MTLGRPGSERLDTISEKQKKILQYTATMEGIKELYHLTMTNVRGFGEETAYYKEIFLLSADILTSVPTVTKYIFSHPVKNYVLCLNELSDVVIETEGLIHDFIEYPAAADATTWDRATATTSWTATPV